MHTNASLARALNALAHPRRVLLFRVLIDSPDAGNSLDSLIAASGLATSSAIHHLREMERAGLVKRQRRGVFTAYRLTPGTLAQALVTALRMSEAVHAAPAGRAA